MHRLRRSTRTSGASVRQMRCYFCSICFLVTFAVFSSLFITSSFPLQGRRRTQMYSQVPDKRKLISSSNNRSLTLTYEVGPPPAPKTIDAGVTGSDLPLPINSTALTITVINESVKDPIGSPNNGVPAKSFGTTTTVISRPTDEVSSMAFKRIQQTCGHGGRTPRVIHDPYPYIINEEALCAGSVFLLIAVHSKASYRMRRDLIRQTWGSVRQYEGHRIKIAFFVGNSNTQSIQESLIAESRINRDLIQRDFTEHYRNMSRKHVSVLRWMADHCHHASYFAKVDDDTFVNIFHTIQLLKMRVPRHFMCKVVTGYPVRNSRSNMRKWYVTRREYPFKKYPLYCEGFAYLIDTAHVKDLYWCSQFTKFFWIDDIFITGIVAKKLKVSRERLWHGHSWAESIPSLASEKIMDYVFIRAGHNEILPHLWLRIWRATLRYSY